MPTRPKSAVNADAVRVLLTGFGPFHHYAENPSWLAVKPLHNVVLSDKTLDPIIVNQHVALSETETKRQHRPIHISCLQIPVTYEAVLEIVPGLHGRPPVLPPYADPLFPPPPDEGYDLMFHIGVAGRGPLRMERVGHKIGYQMKDATGKLAPIVRSSSKDFSRHSEDADSLERERHGMELTETTGEPVTRPTRGFGVTFEKFPDEITTEIDVSRLVQDLKQSGIEQIYTSMDAGHYLCDFIYYCSLAEAKRTAKPYEKRRNTQVLFLHCPPVAQPLSTEEVTEAIKRIVVWICHEIELMDAAERNLEEAATATPSTTK